MLIYIFFGFLAGFFASLFLVRYHRRALIWGLVLGAVPLVMLLGPARAPIQGIGSALNFAFFALGPLMLIPFLASRVALGVAGAAAVLWIGLAHKRGIGWAAGVALVIAVTALTLWPVAQRELAKRQLTESRKARAEAIERANFHGTLAGHPVTFPASPRLHLFDDCPPPAQGGLLGCSTNLTNPVSTLTKPNDVLLHERTDPVRFRSIFVSQPQPACNLGDFCLTHEKIDRWCSEVRPDQADSIWCNDGPPMQFAFRTDAKPGPSNRNEPELATHFSSTPLGS